MITTNYTSEKWQAFAQCAASSVNKDIFFSEEILFISFLLFVLFIHELGHFSFMKKFKYKHVKMLFVPLMGAFVQGKKKIYSQKESLLVVGAGPFPGIILGVILFFLFLSFKMDWLLFLAIMFFLLNIINLLPLAPLDGGQLLKLLLNKSSDLFLLIFYTSKNNYMLMNYIAHSLSAYNNILTSICN